MAITPEPLPTRCENALCAARMTWLWRWKRPAGVWLNGAWYCSHDCFEQGAADLFSQFNLKPSRGRAIRYRLPLGLLLVSKGLISSEHLQDALKAQKESQKGRLGDWLRQHGILTEEQLTGALGAQWGLPVFHLAQSSGFIECAAMAPVHVMEASRMALVHFMPTSRNLYVAFSDGIDFAALRALEQMLDCGTQPCVIGESEMEEALEAMRRMPRPSETVLDGSGAPKSLAATTRGWAESNKASRVRAVVASESLWVRLENTSFTGHLLFRLSQPVPEMVI